MCLRREHGLLSSKRARSIRMAPLPLPSGGRGNGRRMGDKRLSTGHEMPHWRAEYAPLWSSLPSAAGIVVHPRKAVDDGCLPVCLCRCVSGRPLVLLRCPPEDTRRCGHARKVPAVPLNPLIDGIAVILSSAFPPEEQRSSSTHAVSFWLRTRPFSYPPRVLTCPAAWTPEQTNVHAQTSSVTHSCHRGDLFVSVDSLPSQTPPNAATTADGVHAVVRATIVV